MRKTIYLLGSLFLLLSWSCKENDRLLYDNGYKLYFNYPKGRDSITISLVSQKNEEGVYKIPLKLLGRTFDNSKKYCVEVVKSKTDAVEGLHYKGLQSEYDFKANNVNDSLPIVLLKKDKTLDSKKVELRLRLIDNKDFNIAYNDRIEIRIIFSNMLKKPEGNDYYGDMTQFFKLFGEYSRVKHEMIIEMVGHDFWDGNYGNYGGKYGIYYESSYYTPYARKLYQVITNTKVYDENNKLIEPWNVP